MTTINLNTGACAPVNDEVELTHLPVTGKIPHELHGVLLRNGPNPLNGRFEGNDLFSWWPEAAMLHGISLQNGCAAYKNRWVRTQRWAHVHDVNKTKSLVDTNPNVNVLYHADEILVLAEGGAPLAITAELETIGTPPLHTALADGMTGHPKVDPQTGELMSFRSHWTEPYLRYSVTDAKAVQRLDMQIDMPMPAMMHDMAITATHSIFLDLNVAYDFSMLSRGHRMPLRWYDERQSRIGVIPRYGGELRWYAISPCSILHVVNAYNTDQSHIVLDVIRYPWALRLNHHDFFEDSPLGVLWRYVIDLDKGEVAENQLTSFCIELPRINEGKTGRFYQFLYAVEQPTNTEMRGIVRYDLSCNATQRYIVRAGDQNSEPVFVPRLDACSEDDGWLLVCVYRHKTDTSDLVILDGRNIETDPIATVHLPRRIPAGFHGIWLPKMYDLSG